LFPESETHYVRCVTTHVHLLSDFKVSVNHEPID
jgi:hypothetical protein